MADAAAFLRGSCDIWQAPIDTVTTLALIPPMDAAPPAANWNTIAEDNITEDGVTLAHTETVEDQMTLNETVARDDYRTAEEWMLNLTVNSWQADVLQLAMNNNASTTVAPTAAPDPSVGYIRIPMRKGPSVHHLSILARINDAPYRVTGDTVITQVLFLCASQRDGFESNFGPKSQASMVSLNFKGLLDRTLNEVGYIDLTNLPAL